MRVAVLSDIHANLTALEAVLAAAGSVDAIWLLGDVVGYGPDPDAVVARLAAAGATGVRGNHDQAVAVDPDLADWFNPDAKAAIEWTRARVTPATTAWLATLPAHLENGDWTLVHGSPREPLLEYVVSQQVARDAFEALATRFCLHGHTHVPIALVDAEGPIEIVEPGDGDTLDLGERRLLLNPGSVGQPRDGDPAASWLVLDTDAARVTWRRTEYDIAAVQARMLEGGLPARLATRLSLGL